MEKFDELKVSFYKNGFHIKDFNKHVVEIGS